LAIFVKGNKDGKDRDNRILNATLCLDISGSMGSGLTWDSESRLKLAIEAIRMFVSKLRPDDSFGLVIFDNKAEVVIEQTKVKSLDLQKTFTTLETIKTRGGTTIREGFVMSQKILYNYAISNHHPYS
jgi:Mg-chelatase subunit ChlD